MISHGQICTQAASDA